MTHQAQRKKGLFFVLYSLFFALCAGRGRSSCLGGGTTTTNNTGTEWEEITETGALSLSNQRIMNSMIVTYRYVVRRGFEIRDLTVGLIRYRYVLRTHNDWPRVKKVELERRIRDLGFGFEIPYLGVGFEIDLFLCVVIGLGTK